MPRISIYINATLKNSMDRRSDLNWSEIASKAFEESMETQSYEDFLRSYERPKLMGQKPSMLGQAPHTKPGQ